MGMLLGVWRCLFGGSDTAAAAPAAPVNFLTTLSLMDSSQWAEPFVQGATKVTTDLQLMDSAQWAEPFVRYLKV